MPIYVDDHRAEVDGELSWVAEPDATHVLTLAARFEAVAETVGDPDARRILRRAARRYRSAGILELPR